MNNDDFNTDNQNIMLAWISRVRLWLAGMQYGGARDLYAVLGYSRTLQQGDFAARYVRQDIAKRIVDQPVLSMWADPPELQCDPAFMTAWQSLTDPQQSGVYVWQQIIRMDKLAGLGQFAGMVFGFDDGQKLNQPITPNGAKRKLLYLQPYAEQAIRVTQYEKDSTNARYGLPTEYTITPGRFRPELRTGNAGFSYSSETGRGQFTVHWSRFLQIADGLLEDPVYGRSRLECVTNLLDDTLKIAGGGAEAFWLGANRGMQADIDKEMELEPKDEQRLQQEIEDYQHEIRRFIRTRGVTLKPLTGDPADPTGQWAVTLSLLSAATGMPQSIITGSARGENVSQQDRAAWSERVSERATEYGEPVILRPFIATCIQGGVLPQPKAPLQVTWPEAFKLSPLERSQTSAQMARSAANLSKAQDFSSSNKTQPLFTSQEARRMVSFGSRMPVFEKTTPAEQGLSNNSPAMPGAQPDPMMGTGEEED